MLTIEGVRHAFGPVAVLKDISFTVPQGSVFALLGPNGCGKSTLFRIVLGLLTADQGRVSLAGETNPEVYRKRLGVMLDEPGFLDRQTGWQNLQWVATAKGSSLAQARELAEQLEIASALHRRVKGYSLGMKKRLALVAALMGNPEFLLLDEPSNGLDPLHLIQLRNVLQRYVANGGTLLLSSHLLGEVDRIATHVAVMSRGVLVEQGTREEVLAQYTTLEELFVAKVTPSVA